MKSHKLFLNKIALPGRLISYGFVKQGEEYRYSAAIMDGELCVNVSVNESGAAEYEILDTATGDEYAIAYDENAVGAYVSKARAECEEIMSDIIFNCFEADIFKSEYTKRVIAYVRERYGTEAEYLWEKAPDNAIFRYSKTGKWYAALLTVRRNRLGMDSDDTVEIIDLKEEPENILRLVDGKKYFNGFHMNKKHWYTICLDGSVPIDEVYKRIDKSYKLICK